MTSPARPIRIDPDQLALEPLDLNPKDFQSPLPVQNYVLVFEDENIGLNVGIWDTTTMQEAFGPYPGDEYITVLDGGFTMVDVAQAPLAAAQAGHSVTFRNGAPSSWKQDGYLRKIYLTLRPPNAETPNIASADGAFQVVKPSQMPQGKPDADGTTREVIFRNEAGTMVVALCAFAAMALPPRASTSHRLVRVLAGEITLADASARPETFGPETHVFLPFGTVHGWSCTADTRAMIIDVSTT